MLRLELPLPPRPGVDDRPPCVPTLENDVRRDGGPEPPPVVAPVLLTGDMDRTGDIGLPTRPFRSSDGMSVVSCIVCRVPCVRMFDASWQRRVCAHTRQTNDVPFIHSLRGNAG